MDTDSVYLVLSEENLEDVLSPEIESTGMGCVRETAQTFSLSTQQTIFFPECAAAHTRNTIRGNQVSLWNHLDIKMFLFMQ